MFEIFLNLFLISVMISVKCDTPLVIREDRVYRYVGNGSDLTIGDLNEDIKQNMQINETHHSIINEENIPESLLIQLKDINNASDFISNFLMTKPDKEDKDVFLEYLEQGYSLLENGSKNNLDINHERSKLSKLPKIGTPAGCIPEMKIIELKPPESHNELYFPSCVRISRCSGCCPSQRLQCVPISTSFEDITVIRVKYSSIERRLKFEGFKVLRIEAHNRCNCDCIQKSNDCSSNQIYSESECRCLCGDSSAAKKCQNDYNKYWDHNECRCNCKSVPFCSTGFFFDNSTCRCRPEEEEEDNENITSSLSPTINNERQSSYKLHRYVLDKRINSEIEVQDNKGQDLFKVRGINPDINEEFHENSSLQ